MYFYLVNTNVHQKIVDIQYTVIIELKTKKVFSGKDKIYNIYLSKCSYVITSAFVKGKSNVLTNKEIWTVDIRSVWKKLLQKSGDYFFFTFFLVFYPLFRNYGLEMALKKFRNTKRPLVQLPYVYYNTYILNPAESIFITIINRILTKLWTFIYLSYLFYFKKTSSLPTTCIILFAYGVKIRFKSQIDQ